MKPREGYYTPVTPQLIGLLYETHEKIGGPWWHIAALMGTRYRTVRFMRAGRRRAVSYGQMDRLIRATGVGSLDDFVWFTADDLVALGIWEAHSPHRGNGPAQREGYKRWQAMSRAEKRDRKVGGGVAKSERLAAKRAKTIRWTAEQVEQGKHLPK